MLKVEYKTVSATQANFKFLESKVTPKIKEKVCVIAEKSYFLSYLDKTKPQLKSRGLGNQKYFQRYSEKTNITIGKKSKKILTT